MKKPTRHSLRAQALQILYQMETSKAPYSEEALTSYLKNFSETAEPDPFVKELVMGVSERISELDKLIAKTSENWRLSRMSFIDRNILRLGAFELKYCNSIPITVTLNEMIELAKDFGGEESPGFINGILDKIKEDIDTSKKAP